VKNASEMSAALKEASSQILQKKYDSFLKYHGIACRLHYAVSFHDKQALIEKVLSSGIFRA